MADERTLNTKEPQRLAKRLKKLFRCGSKRPQSRSNLPPVLAVDPLVSAPPPVDALAPIPPPPPLPPPIIIPPVDTVAHADLAVSSNDPAPPIDPAPDVAISMEEAAKLRAKYTYFRILVI
ncbi:hypothetical protein H0H92_015740, partial [Tricholoma furcatifolium]